MNLFDDKGFATGTMKNILSNQGKLVFSKEDLPKHGKLTRVNALGFTLPTEHSELIPYDSNDLYIGRLCLEDGELATDDFVIYVITDLEQGHYLYVTTHMFHPIQREVFGQYYAYVNNHKNYHGMWFRATIQSYKTNHPNWDSEIEKTFGDLKSIFDSHYDLSKNQQINRFVVEMNALEDFYCWVGFLNLSDKARYAR